MSADVSESSGNNSLPFTCNALGKGKKANAGSKPQLAIIVLVHLKCGSSIKSLSSSDLTPIRPVGVGWKLSNPNDLPYP
jgi:hypothetical protein